MKTDNVLHTIQIIFCNDLAVYAIITDKVTEEVTNKLKELKEEYYTKNKYRYKDYDEYEGICYWHIHTVKGHISSA